MSEADTACAVCERLRSSGSYDRDRDVFICADCERDAKQFVEIQDDLCGSDAVGRSASAEA